MSDKNRDPAMDIIRCIAFLCVVCVHFFLNSGFYNEIVAGRRMFCMTLMRSAFMVCVPLFILLSGHLMGQKAPIRTYYAKIVRILLIYVLACICSLLFKQAILKEHISLADGIWSILDFSASEYSWYVEMYIGLFLLIPFLNILYQNIPCQHQKKLLIGSLLFLTSLPGIINVYNFTDSGWWSAPGLSTSYQFILPDWWSKLYPVTYYFIGSYLKEYPLKLRKSTHFLLMVAAFLGNGLYNFYRSKGVLFAWGAWQNWGALPIVIQSVLFFSFLANQRYDWCGPRLRNFLAKISSLCFGGYLVSSIFDTLLYGILNSYEPVMKLRINWFPVIVPFVYIFSLCLSDILEILSTLLLGIFSKAKSRQENS